MKKVLFLILFLFPFVVSANCNNSDLTRYRNMASHLRSYNIYDDASNTFSIVVENVHSDFYVYDKTNDRNFYTSSSGLSDVVISNLTPGKSVTLKFLTSGGECSGYTVYSMYVSIPHFNPYYSDSVCVNNNSSLCSKWANTSSLTYEQFVDSVKDSIIDDTVPDKEREEYVDEYGFFDFLADYYIYILLFIIVSGSFGIYVLDKKSKFDL